MLNYNGFTLIEVIISASIIFLLILVIIPLTSLLHQERKVLSDRRTASYQLHDELQTYLWTSAELPQSYSLTVHFVDYNFHFTNEEDLLKGCVTWENVRQTEETLCLYGIPNK